MNFFRYCILQLCVFCFALVLIFSVEMLTLFMHCSPGLAQHLYDCYFELSGKSLMFISKSVLEVFLLLFGTYSSLFSLILFVGF